MRTLLMPVARLLLAAIGVATAFGQTQFRDQMQRLAQALSRAYAQNPGEFTGIPAKMAASGSPLMRDAWGTELRLEPDPQSGQTTYYFVRSGGPDRRFGNDDDLVAELNVQAGIVATTARPSVIDIERDLGAADDLAEITGLVIDPSGYQVSGASVSVEVRPGSTGAIRTTHTDPDGRFHLMSLPAGDYMVRVLGPPLEPALGDLTLKAGDRAKLTVRLWIGLVVTVIGPTAIP